MFEVFKYVDKFFTSLTNYLTYNDIFLIFVGLFVFTLICVFISTANAYESKLIKAVDRFNAYFIDNPQINEENLVSFNAKMKQKFVPKQLRKSWQQFVLYRENKASSYMSFENCVSNPIKNSSYKRDTKLMNILSYIFAVCALILNCYYCYESTDLANVLSSVLLTPIIILLLNYIMQIFFNIKHSAIVSDLFQNYQYFEVNIDKATETLPEYVDYEVLFDRNEIKKGIPILYAYLQKRAEEEQRELERARLRNVEHEKFNFDDAGVEASLVLERAMQEAENYIAERKKYNQDTEQINSDITQEDMNYREITKEYNRQMQVSKETFANFKAQLEEVSSTIEANYLKKQQQQELDRQRNLERDFDTATERHKKVIESYHAELDTVDNFIAESRKNLENAMKSEFSTYSSKVYDEVQKVVEQRQKEKVDKLKEKIVELEEELVVKNKDLDKAYQENQTMSEKLEQLNIPLQPVDNSVPAAPVEIQPEYMEPEYTQPEYTEPEFVEQNIKQEQVPEFNYNQPIQEENVEPIEEYPEYSYDQLFEQPENDILEEYDEFNEDQADDLIKPEYIESVEEIQEEPIVEDENVQDVEEVKDDKISTETIDDSIEETKPVSKRGRPRKVVDAEPVGQKKSRGRPKKQETAVEAAPKRKVGRPKKVTTEENVEQKPIKKGRGRPKKVVTNTMQTEQVKKGRGRPKKVVSETTAEVKAIKKGRGRPKKVQTATQTVQAQQKKGRGRPKKITAEKTEAKPIKKGRGRPKKVESIANAKLGKLSDSIVDIDEYIKQIDNAIAEENAKLEETKKELAKNAKPRNRKK